MHIHSRWSASTIMTVWEAAKTKQPTANTTLDDAVLDGFVRRLVSAPPAASEATPLSPNDAGAAHPLPSGEPLDRTA